jgi:hypothetical protein
MPAFSLDRSPQVARYVRRSWLTRVIAAVEDSRMRSARARLAHHRHLLPRELERAGDRVDARNEDHLPFIRRD